MAASQSCDDDANFLAWLLLLTSVFTTFVGWWVLLLPVLWAKHNGGLKEYLFAVCWECLRLHLPGACFTFSITDGNNSDTWLARYYTGRSDPLRPTKRVTTVVTDLLTIIGAVVAIHRTTVILSSDQPDLSASTYVFPVVPVALFGLCLSLSAWMKWKVNITVVFTVAVFLIVGAAGALVIWRFDAHNSGVWYIAILGYAFMGLSAILPLRSMHVFQLMATFIRIVPIIGGATSSVAYFPVCQLKTWAFAGPLLALGILGSICAVVGHAWISVRLKKEANAKKQMAGQQQVGQQPQPQQPPQGQLQQQLPMQQPQLPQPQLLPRVESMA
ncbi:hypothetical protein HK405_004370 [Cladochytrium tenue]|nr:hypothetical protein HK405_004370 [Cladochytrium tenue]